MKAIKYFIFVMKAPKSVYGGFFGKLKHFMAACKTRSEIRREVRS